MSLVHAYRQSVAVRWFSGSGIAGALSRTPRAPVPVLAHSVTLGWLAAIPRLPMLATLLALITGAIGLFFGDAVLAMAGLVFVGSVYRPAWALWVTPALLIWAPKLPLAILGDEVFFLRLDQAAIAGMLTAALANRERPAWTPPSHVPLLLFLMALPASVLAGVWQGTLHTPVSAALYLGQWFTWYGLFVAACIHGRNHGPGIVYAWTLPLLALAAYGIAEAIWPYHAGPGVRYRTFERGWFPGQANHAGGLLALGTVTGLALAATARFRLLGAALAVLATLALFPTGSRSGMAAWAAGLVLLAMISMPALRWWFPPLGLVGLCAVSRDVWYGLSAPGSSMYDRLVAWKSALSTAPEYPWLGLGAGARHRSYYDSQYFMTLAESGLVGLVLLAAVMISMALALNGARKSPGSPLALGATAGVGLVAVHSLATASLIVTMVAGPLFWLCGVALAPRAVDP